MAERQKHHRDLGQCMARFVAARLRILDEKAHLKYGRGPPAANKMRTSTLKTSHIETIVTNKNRIPKPST